MAAASSDFLETQLSLVLNRASGTINKKTNPSLA
jgi:hypothetical protein